MNVFIEKILRGAYPDIFAALNMTKKRVVDVYFERKGKTIDFYKANYPLSIFNYQLSKY